MHHIKNISLYLIVLAIQSLLGLSVNAQFVQAQAEESLATKSYLEWKQKVVAENPSIDNIRYRGIGIAISKIGNKGINVDITAGVSSDFGTLSPLDITVQPLSLNIDGSGEQTLTKMGEPFSLKTPSKTNYDIKSEFLVTPKMSIPTSSEVFAVEVIVKGLLDDSGVSSVKLLVRDTPTTANLGVVIASSKTSSICKQFLEKQKNLSGFQNKNDFTQVSFGKKVLRNSNSGECYWYTGSCGELCGTLCVEYNNASPHLNCIECTMSCANNGDCKGAGGTPPTECGSQS